MISVPFLTFTNIYVMNSILGSLIFRRSGSIALNVDSSQQLTLVLTLSGDDFKIPVGLIIVSI